MILKSLSRKQPTFLPLLRYIRRRAEADFVFTQNLSALGVQEISEAFKANYACLTQKQSHYNALYHEIISLKRFSDIPLSAYTLAFYELLPQYMALRGPDLLAYGVLHVEAEHVHVHMVLSANGYGNGKRHRLSRADFSAMQRSLENQVLTQHPYLQQPHIYEQTGYTIHTRAEQEMLARGKVTHVESMRTLVSALMAQVNSVAELRQQLEKKGISSEFRGQQLVVVDAQGKRYRLRRLGLQAEYQALLDARRVTLQKSLVSQPNVISLTPELWDGHSLGL